MKKRWILAPAAVALLALGVLTAGAAFAQEGDTESTSTVGKFASKVAAILGLEETQVQDAMDQARRELVDEAVQEKLGALVEAGRLTQEQADEYYAWFQARPEGLVPGLLSKGIGRGHHHGMGKGFMGPRGFGFYLPPAVETPEAEETPESAATTGIQA